MSKDKYLKPVLRMTRKNVDNVVNFETKFHQLYISLRDLYYEDKIPEDKYDEIYNLIYDMLEIFYDVGGIEL